MKRKVTELRYFTKTIERLIAKRKVLASDFEEFKENLAENPEAGDLITGSGGVRKTRLKGPSRGKSSGFRVIYLDDSFKNEIFLIVIYPKNEKEDLEPDEKKYLKELTKELRAR
jgi:hypothetical protein